MKFTLFSRVFSLECNVRGTPLGVSLEYDVSDWHLAVLYATHLGFKDALSHAREKHSNSTNTIRARWKRGVFMLRISTLVAIIGTIVCRGFWIMQNLGPFKLSITPEIAVLITSADMICLVQFFIVFLIKLSATKK